MRRLNYVTCVAAAALATACGGGGGGESVSPLIQPVELDSYTFAETTQRLGPDGTLQAATTEYSTHTVESPKADLSHRRVVTAPHQFRRFLEVSSANRVAAHSDSTTWCRSTPAVDKPGFSPAVGQAWTAKINESCTDITGKVKLSGWISEVQSKVVAKEAYRSDAGQFTAFKIETDSKVLTRPAGTTTFEKQVCWLDEKNGVALSCITTVSASDAATAPVLSKTETSLIGMDAKNHPQSKPRTERFAGDWNLGAGELINCNMAAALDGAVTGECFNPFASMLEISLTGTITAEGVFNAKTSSGVTFSGRLSTLLANGPVATADGKQGTWVAIHK